VVRAANPPTSAMIKIEIDTEKTISNQIVFNIITNEEPFSATRWQCYKTISVIFHGESPQ
jgi:hypothetical protein